MEEKTEYKIDKTTKERRSEAFMQKEKKPSAERVETVGWHVESVDRKTICREAVRGGLCPDVRLGNVTVENYFLQLKITNKHHGAKMRLLRWWLTLLFLLLGCCCCCYSVDVAIVVIGWMLLLLG